MNVELRIYDIVMYIYALSLLFYFSDFLAENRKLKQVGTGLLVFVWMLSGGFIVIRLITEIKAPIFEFTSFDLLQLFSWLLITISFLISKFYKIELIVFFVNVIGFAIYTLNIYRSSHEGRTLEIWETTRELLYVHISLVISAYAKLLSIMYVIAHSALKQKKRIKWIRRFPSLEVMELTTQRLVVIGVPLLIMSLAIAIVSVIVEGRAYQLLDLQIIMSLCALGAYGYFIYQRAVNKKSGLAIAKIYLIAFAFQLINMFSTGFSSLH